MPKGKKFDAAEKHFMEKERFIKKELKEKTEECIGLRTILKNTIDENNTKCKELEKEVERLNSFVKVLIKYTKLSEEELHTISQKDIALTNFLQSSTAIILSKMLKI